MIWARVMGSVGCGSASVKMWSENFSRGGTIQVDCGLATPSWSAAGRGHDLGHRAGLVGVDGGQVGRRQLDLPGVGVAAGVGHRQHVAGGGVHDHHHPTLGLHGLDLGHEQVLGHVLQVAVEGEHEVVAGRRGDQLVLSGRDRAPVLAPLPDQLAGLAGQHLVVGQLQPGGALAVGIGAADDAGRQVLAGLEPARLRVVADAGQVERPDLLGHRVVDLAGHVRELPLVGRRGAEQPAGQRVRLGGVEVQHGGEGVGGPGRVDDQPGVGPDRRLRDGDAPARSRCGRRWRREPRAGWSSAPAGARRPRGTRPPRPSAAGRRGRAGSRTRPAPRRARRPGGAGCVPRAA